MGLFACRGKKFASSPAEGPPMNGGGAYVHRTDPSFALRATTLAGSSFVPNSHSGELFQFTARAFAPPQNTQPPRARKSIIINQYAQPFILLFEHLLILAAPSTAAAPSVSQHCRPQHVQLPIHMQVPQT